MNFKKKLILTLILLSLVLCTVSAVSAEDLTFNEAQTLINSPDTDGNVYLNNATYVGTGQVITIERSNLIIYGGTEEEPYKSSTLNGKNLSGIITVNSGCNNIKFIGINFINGKSVYGGAIYFASGSDNNKWYDCTFTNNRANKNGGAIYFASGSNSYNSWYDCTFNKNIAFWDGGAISFDSTTSSSNNNNTWENCTFINGQTYNCGGAICLYSTSTSSSNSYNSWRDCKFNNNTADAGNGGAVYIDTGTSSYSKTDNNNNNTWENCIFTNNNGNDMGAVALYSTSKSSNNNNKWINSTFNNNRVYNRGGAICLCSDSYYENINNNNYMNCCIFTNNTVLYGVGGAIYFDSGSSNNVSYCIFDNNDAQIDKAIYINDFDALDFNNNFWGTKNTITPDEFNSMELVGYYDNIFAPEKFIVLNINANSNNYTLYFTYNGTEEDIGSKMPNYSVNIKFNGADDVITDMGNHSYPDDVGGNTNIGVYSIFGDNLLAETQAEIIPEIELNGNNIIKYINGPEQYIVSLTINGKALSNEKIFITIGDTHYIYSTDKNGIVRVDLDLDVGKYTAVAKWNNYTIQNTITVLPVPLEYELIGNDVVKYVNGTECYAVTLLHYGNPLMGEKIVINLDGVSYTRATDENGTVTLPIDLDVGTYTVTAKWNNYTASNSITVKPHIFELQSSDLIKYFKGAQCYTVTLKEDGKPLIGEKIIINLNGVSYTRITNENGTASMNINLNPGNYEVFAKWNGYTVKNTVIVKSTIQCDNLIKYYLNGTQYEACVVDSKGNPLNGVNFTFNIHGIFYHKTAHNGVVKLNINLLPGQYTITAYNDVTGEASSNYVVVLPTLFGSDLTMIYKDGSAYECKFVDGQGKPVKGANLVFNINGVFYNKITDNDGIARLNINLLPGEYIITAIYGGTMTSNIISVRD